MKIQTDRSLVLALEFNALGTSPCHAGTILYIAFVICAQGP
jgi:hypothetical protein